MIKVVSFFFLFLSSAAVTEHDEPPTSKGETYWQLNTNADWLNPESAKQKLQQTTF